MRNAYRILLGKPGEKKPLRGQRRKWEDKIKIKFKKSFVSVWTGFIWLRLGLKSGILRTQ
jgi:hypothetical protein